MPRDVIATMMPLGNEVPADLQACWDVDFWVADVEGVAKRTTELGGRVISQPAEVPGVPMKEGVIADPDGATLSVTQLLLPG